MKFKLDPDHLEPFESLQDSLERLTRPIQLAAKTSSSQLSCFKNLGSYISSHILQILRNTVLPPATEADLLSLRQVFLDYDDGLEEKELQLRIAEGKKLLNRLQNSCHSPSKNTESSSTSPALPGEKKDKVPFGNKRNSSLHSSEFVRSDSLQNVRNPVPADVPYATPELWSRSIQFAKGVGPARATLLKKLGVVTIEDAFWFLPWRYEDRSVISPISSLRPGIKATISGTVRSHKLHRTARRRLMVLNVLIHDGTGDLECVFFNQPYLEKTFVEGVHVLITGVVSIDRTGNPPFQMRGPQYEILEVDDRVDQEVGRIIPIYHETRGISSRQLRRILSGLHHQYHHLVDEILPPSLSAALHLPTLKYGLVQLHFPNQEQDIDHLNRGITSAHQRLAFEELLVLQVALAVRRRMMKTEAPGISFAANNDLVIKLREHLPFSLTASQEKVIREIQDDMVQAKCMNRLIQGDVGSGKTVVALHAIVMACGSGYQIALMAPTEVLSEQHYLTLAPYFRALGVKAVLVKGGQSKRERGQVLTKLRTGEAQIAIGTHALLQPEVGFAKLGLVVVDEQHKFGVLQRSKLRDKGGQRPDVLVMTATPIPRTLAMTAYGDLDVSVIDQLPPGRKTVSTLLFRASQKKAAYDLLRKEVEAGRQAYVVYPLVEQSEKLDLQDAIQAAEQLQTREFPTKNVGLLHGRMKSKEKQAIMTQFKTGHLHVLVATTVIEVGVDVPNATVMVVEHADRFGLAQLHQLRGRVGRGSQQAYCLLVSSSVRRASSSLSKALTANLPFTIHKNSTGVLDPLFQRFPQSARQRLEVLAKCSDGFELAEEDLKLRGPGDLLGIRQWGEIDFRVADLLRDYEILVQAKKAAQVLLQDDPNLAQAEHQRLKATVLRRWGAKFDLGSVG